MRCIDCEFWGDGNGTGLPYDAGHMNDCRNPHISGNHHPSYGACGETETKVWAQACNDNSKRYYGSVSQILMTRYNFGCVLFVQRKK